VKETVETVAPAAERRLAFFERYLSLWVALCMAAGVIAGKAAPAAVQSIRCLEFGQGRQINVPIAILIWLMRPINISRAVSFWPRRRALPWFSDGAISRTATLLIRWCRSQ